MGVLLRGFEVSGKVTQGRSKGKRGRQKAPRLPAISSRRFLRTEYGSGCESAPPEQGSFCVLLSLCLCAQRKGPGSGQEDCSKLIKPKPLCREPCGFLSLKVLPESPGRRGHSLGGSTFPPAKHRSAYRPGEPFAHIRALRPRAPRLCAPFQVRWPRFSPSQCELQNSVPASCPLGMGGGRQPSGPARETGGGAVRADRRCLSVTVAAGAPDPDKRPPARSALLPFTFPKPILGSFNTLKWPAKLSRAQIHPHGEDVRIFFFF